jgi:signal peptidase I
MMSAGSGCHHCFAMMMKRRVARLGVAGIAMTGMLAGCGVGLPNSLKTYKQASPSMQPAIQVGDVLTRSGVGTPYRGEVVYVNAEDVEQLPHGSMVIKRIVGLPGERVAATYDGFVTINGRRLAEPYLAPGTLTEHMPSMTVPAGEYFLLGDNRSASSDSRNFGTVQRIDLVGSSHRIVRPLKHAGRIKGT